MGHCLTVRIENIIETSRTAAIVDREKAKTEDAHAQTLNILERVERVLEDFNTSMEDVILTHMFTADVSTFETVATAHTKFFFKDIKPTTDFCGINQLVAPEYAVEIEFTAIAPKNL